MLKPSMSNDWQNKIDFFSLENQKIVYTQLIDNSIFWVNNLTQKKELVFLNKEYAVYHCYEHNFYIAYLIKDDAVSNVMANDLRTLIEKNYVHYVLNDSRFALQTKDILLDLSNSDNFDYSILMICSEVLTEDNPFEIEKFEKLKYFFSCTNMISSDKKSNSKWALENADKMKVDYKYSLTYYYHKFGFCYYQKGNQQLEISNRKNKVFLYSKHSGEHTERFKLIKQAIDTDKIEEKPYTNDDWFWYFVNYNYYHMPFFNDYNTCKFNLVMETQPPIQINNNSNLFVSEKTLKALMVSTPAYVCLQYPVYQNLKKAGFYFLNEEFGKYDNSSDLLSNSNIKAYETNYNKFCNWLKNASDDKLNEMFEKAYIKSINNKKVLEDWFASDKNEEINLLINT
jgi:hypothetical protein